MKYRWLFILAVLLNFAGLSFFTGPLSAHSLDELEKRIESELRAESAHLSENDPELIKYHNFYEDFRRLHAQPDVPLAFVAKAYGGMISAMTRSTKELLAVQYNSPARKAELFSLISEYMNLKSHGLWKSRTFIADDGSYGFAGNSHAMFIDLKGRLWTKRVEIGLPISAHYKMDYSHLRLHLEESNVNSLIENILDPEEKLVVKDAIFLNIVEYINGTRAIERGVVNQFRKKLVEAVEVLKGRWPRALVLLAATPCYFELKQSFYQTVKVN